MRARVLLVSPVPPPEGGIATWTVVALASSLASEFEIRVLDTAPPDKHAVSAERRFRPIRAVASLGVLCRAVFLFFRFRPQIVHVNTPYGWAFVRDGGVCWLARLFGARCVLHFHGSVFPEFVEAQPALLQRAIRATLEKCSLLIALESKTETYLRGLCPGVRLVQLPNPVLRNAFTDVPRLNSSPKERTELLYVGWIVESKGIVELLDAVGAEPAIQLSLVGPEDPEFRQQLQPALERLGDRVQFFGPCSHEGVIERFGKSDIVVLPSHVEAFPFVVLEAMAAGRPVVATDVGAIPEMIRDGTDGFVVRPHDAQALAECLGQLVANPELRARMGASGRDRVEERYDVQVVFGRLAELYRELAGD